VVGAALLWRVRAAPAKMAASSGPPAPEEQRRIVRELDVVPMQAGDQMRLVCAKCVPAYVYAYARPESPARVRRNRRQSAAIGATLGEA